MRTITILFLLLLIGATDANAHCASWGYRTYCRAGAQEGDAFSMITGRTCTQRRVCRRWVRHHAHGWRREDRHWRDGGHRHERYREVSSYDRRYHDDHPPRSRYERECWPMVQVMGVEAQTENGALISAKRVWRASVRAAHGERYQDLDSSRRTAYRCWRSSTNESTIGKVGEFIAGAYRKRCEIRAVPCLGEWQRLEGDRDDRE